MTATRSPLATRLALLALVLLLVVAFFAVGGPRWLTLDGLKSSLGTMQRWHAAQPVLAAGVFFVVYVLVAALSLPGASILTLAGGAMFGLGWGLVLTSFASTIGATLAFLASRYLVRDWVQRRLGQRLLSLQGGAHDDLAYSLFTLRLVPVFPYFLVNLAMGLLPIRPLTFFWVSQVGMLPGTFVYVNAGTQLARIDSLSDIVSGPLLLSFALLGIFPWIARLVLDAWQRRRVYAKWPRPARFDRNLMVIGAGAGGLVSAYIAAAVKAKVTLVESHRMGGDCLNTGCVPSKALIRAAKAMKQIAAAPALGVHTAKGEVDFAALMQRVRQVIADIEPHDSVARYTGLGVEVLQGHARITSPWTVEIHREDGTRQTLSTRAIVIAAGARPTVPPIPGLAEVGYLTSDTLWNLTQRPQRLLVLGGGPIGCELAQAFARLGSAVTLVEMAPRVLLREDEEVSALVAQALVADGVALLTGHEALRCEQRDGHKRLVVRHAAQERAIAFDALLCAVGRTPRVEGYGLEALGIPLTPRGTVATNAWLQTRYPNIYAVGDVAGPYQLTHVAAHQAWYAAVNALFGRFRRFKADYSVIPWTTFTDPEVARVGLSEAEARERGIACEVTRYGIDDLDRAIADGVAHGVVKVLTAPGKDRILGVTIVGEHAGDLLAEYVLAMKHGIGLNKILGTIHSYPTLAEANKYAAGEWKRAHAPQRLLRWVQRYHDWERG